MKDQRNDTLQFGKIRLYPERRRCFVGTHQIVLTAKEFDLLQELMQARGNVMRREVLMDKVWGYHGEATSRTLDTHIRRLREKLGEDGLHVETVRGVGYRMGIQAEDA
jgi:DNA-binding response OmpR family regulator